MKTVQKYISEAIVKGKLTQYNNYTTLHVYKRINIDGDNEKNVRSVLIKSKEQLEQLINIIYKDRTREAEHMYRDMLSRFNKCEQLFIRPNPRGRYSVCMFGSKPSQYYDYIYDCDISIKDFNGEFWDKKNWCDDY